MAVSAARRWLFQRRRTLLLAACAIVTGGLLLAFTWGALWPYPVGAAQPIPISHRIHAGVRGISCLFCHDGADRSPSAGMPEVRKCLLCHNVIAKDFEPIRALHGYFGRSQPIPWRRVYMLPDYAHFSHEMHLAGGVDCGECHGDVKSMDRIIEAMPMEMGFCVDCHRKNDAPVLCTTCHY
jgi:hypothetical protein